MCCVVQRLVVFVRLFLNIHSFTLGFFSYIIAKRRLHETCITHQQCTGTDNANTCHFEDGVCICSNRYKVIDGKCLEGKNVVCIHVTTRNRKKIIVNDVC